MSGSTLTSDVTTAAPAVPIHPTRETWLRAAALELNTILLHNVPDFPLSLDALAVSVGLPKGGRKRIGECWSREVAADAQTHHVFISPVLDNVALVLSTLLHEMIHAAVGVDQKHKGEFVKAARAVGFEKPWTQTPVPAGSGLEGALREIAGRLGAYPHVALRPKQKPASDKLSSTVKFVSTLNDEFVIRMSRRLVEDFGAPRDPDGEEMVEMEA